MNEMWTAFATEERPSNRARIQELAVGESFARAVRIDGDLATKDRIHETARGLRLATQPTVHRVSQNTGQKYTIEQGEFRTSSRDLIIVLVVTRLA